jgi:hypothetical protein
MKRDNSGPILTAVFVDYDNIYLSLKRRNEEAAKRFAKDAALWIREIESGRLLTPTNGPRIDGPRRLVLNRCYGNPVPRRNTHDNSTDMNSFPFVRHHFLRAGFEVIDCPPLTAQLKNSSDIRMVMDVRDYLTHETHFDEFVILSGDADFTPVLHRLRAHARHTVIFANDYTAAPYTAICDGEVRETDLMGLLLDGRLPGKNDQPAITTELDGPLKLRHEIADVVASAVRAAGGPVPLETLAQRTTRALGHDRTIGTSWAGAGSFLELLQRTLPEDIKLTDQPPYLAYDARRGLTQTGPAPLIGQSAEPSRNQIAPARAKPAPAATVTSPLEAAAPATAPIQRSPLPALGQRQPAAAFARAAPLAGAPQPAPATQTVAAAPTLPMPSPQPQRPAELATQVQQSVARIYDACQAPPLSPQEYRLLFDLIAQEITEGGLQGAQTLANIGRRTQENGLQMRRDDIRFILEVVSEADPWFEQGASANLFAGRFRNFVVARCRSQGLALSTEELDLIDAWFAGSSGSATNATAHRTQVAATDPTGGPQLPFEDFTGDEFPKILRSRLRG